MTCSKCGKTLPGDAKFCPECGTASPASSQSGAEADVSIGGMRTMQPATSDPENSPPPDRSLNSLPTMGASPPDPGHPAPDAGTPLALRYELLEEIGHGGFAVVWKARDRKLGRIVAVKRLQPEALRGNAGEQTLARFRREAQAIAGLNHRNIVAVYDHDRDAEGDYIVMEYVAGGTLRQHLKEHGGKLPVPEAVALVRGIAQGLAYAHRKNLVHRDIKPANILLHREGEETVPKIVDFGLARAGSDSEISQSGYGMGTPWYMPPEQRRDAKGVNHTADIYALGKVLYELASGDVPDNIDPEKLPPALAKIVLKCCKSNPEERFFSCEELLAALEAEGNSRKPTAADGSNTAGRGDGEEENACPACGVANAPDVKFCENCGGGMTCACPECGRDNSVHKLYCGGCGTEVKGFLIVREALERIQRYTAEKRWSRVIKEAALLDETAVRLPDSQGRAMLAEIKESRNQAEQALVQFAQLLQTLTQSVDEGAFEAAAAIAGEMLEIDPHDVAFAALAEKIGAAASLAGQAEAMAGNGDLESAQRALAKLQEIAEARTGAKRLAAAINERLARAAELRRQARVYLEGKRPDLAEPCWQEALSLNAIAGDAEIGRRIAFEQEMVADLLKQACAALDHARVSSAKRLARKALEHRMEAPEALAVLERCNTIRRKRLRLALVAVIASGLALGGGGVLSATRARTARKRAEAFYAAWHEEAASIAERMEQAPTAAAARALLNEAEQLQQSCSLLAPTRFSKAGKDGLDVENSRIDNLMSVIRRQTDEIESREECERRVKVAEALDAARQAKAEGRWNTCYIKAITALKLDLENTEALSLMHEACKADITRNLRDEEYIALDTIWSAVEQGKHIEFYRGETIDSKQPKANNTEADSLEREAIHVMFSDMEQAEKQKKAIKMIFDNRSYWKTQAVDLGDGVKLEMVWCPAGTFSMGSPSTESGRDDDETQHRVTLTKGFWMGKYEVTQAQWETVMGSNPAYFKNADRTAPVEQVSWDDCQEFVRTLNTRIPGGGFRLPTEAEWEYACRAGTTTVFHYGNDLDASKANLDGSYPNGNDQKGEYRQTLPVGSFWPNDLGLYDMHGNVWEWCSDWYGEYPSGSVTDPFGPGSGSFRVYRGGSWFFGASYCRSAFRGRYRPSITSFSLGFRVVLAPVP